MNQVVKALGKVLSRPKSEAFKNTVAEASKILVDERKSQAERDKALATIIVSELNSSHLLSSLWRPGCMVFCMMVIACYWIGFAPADLHKPLSPLLEKIFELLYIGLAGYIPARSLEKIVTQVQLGSVVKKLLSKDLTK